MQKVDYKDAEMVVETDATRFHIMYEQWWSFSQKKESCEWEHVPASPEWSTGIPGDCAKTRHLGNHFGLVGLVSKQGHVRWVRKKGHLEGPKWQLQPNHQKPGLSWSWRLAKYSQVFRPQSAQGQEEARRKFSPGHSAPERFCSEMIKKYLPHLSYCCRASCGLQTVCRPAKATLKV